jgi:SAM-dependent methyltransferase
LSAPAVFDQQHYELLNRTRGDVVRALLGKLKEPLGLQTAIDVGCGLGYFSGFLRSLGFDVTAVDGRQENVAEAQRRNPDIRFFRLDAEDPAMKSLGKFDLVFCFGLLYHLENPFLTVRHLREMTRSLLLVEAVTYLGDEPIMGFVDESSWEDQGLRSCAFYPTEACLIKMMYRGGFPNVFRSATMPDHSEYRDTVETNRIRTVLAASTVQVSSSLLTPLPEPPSAPNPWKQQQSMSALAKLHRFVAKPLPQKIASIKRLVKRR